jgi:hypothetical protein
MSVCLKVEAELGFCQRHILDSRQGKGIHHSCPNCEYTSWSVVMGLTKLKDLTDIFLLLHVNIIGLSASKYFVCKPNIKNMVCKRVNVIFFFLFQL